MIKQESVLVYADEKILVSKSRTHVIPRIEGPHGLSYETAKTNCSAFKSFTMSFIAQQLVAEVVSKMVQQNDTKVNRMSLSPYSSKKFMGSDWFNDQLPFLLEKKRC